MNRYQLCAPLGILLILLSFLSCEDNDNGGIANSLPQLSVPSVELDEETGVTFEVLAEDDDLDSLEVLVVAEPLHGELSAITAPLSAPESLWFSYVPDSGYVGEDQALLRVWDGQDSSAVAQVNFIVVPVNTEEAAVIIGESLALKTGGAFEALEAVGNLIFLPPPTAFAPSKNRHTDDAVFDPDSCIWTIATEREFEEVIAGDTLGFSWQEDWQVWLRNSADSCLVFPDTTMRWLDERRQFSGHARNRRFVGTKSGNSSFHLSEFNSGAPGVVVNGSHSREGQGRIKRRDFWVNYSFNLELRFYDVRTIAVGPRRLPSEGQIELFLHALRGQTEIFRHAWISFGVDNNGQIDFDDGEEWVFDSYTGNVGIAQ